MPSLNLDVLPPDNRGRNHIDAHRELFYRTQDIIAVFNPTDEDFRITYDAAVSGEAFVVPNQKRDVGYGKGTFHLKRYVARLYLKRMGTKLIHEKSNEVWDKEKLKYRLEERGQFREKLGLKTSDRNAWEEVTKQIWLGVVEKYRPGIEEYQPRELRKPKADRMDDILDSTGLLDKPLYSTDMELEPIKESDLEERKRALVSEIT